MEALFWLSAGMIMFSYFGYPFTLVLLKRFRRHDHIKKEVYPPVTLIITAFNEEKRIRTKLDNTVALEYPRENLQVIVASDGSTDRTNEIVESYADKGVELLLVKERKGKENAQREAVEVARGEILVFSDTATRLDPDGLKQIVFNFADPTIGCVSSEDRIISEDGESAGGEGAYVKYEMWLRGLESSVNTVVGLSGSFFAARKEVCSDFSSNMQSDFRTLLSSMKRGMRGVSDPEAIGYYQDLKDRSREFSRKVRTVLRGLTVFFNHAEFFNVFRYGLFTYQYLSHKLCRWLVPVFMLTALASNIVLALKPGLYRIILAPQLGFYLAALAGLTFAPLERIVLVRIPKYFTIVNLSILVAWFRFVRGERITLWKPSVR